MPAGRAIRICAALLLTTGLVRVAASADTDPAKQRDEQKKIKLRIEEASRRASSTIDAMFFQRLSPRLESKMLEEVADSLKGLSQDEIKAILDHLEKAVTAPDPTIANKEQLQAYEKHRAVVAQLRGILVKLDVIKNLDEAAARLDRASADQLAINGETLATQNIRKRPGFGDVHEDLMDKQSSLGSEVAAIFTQIDKLYPFLNPQQKERVDAAEVKVKGAKIVSEMAMTVRNLRDGKNNSAMIERATELQRRHSKELKDLAAALRTPPGDKLTALRASPRQGRESHRGPEESERGDGQEAGGPATKEYERSQTRKSQRSRPGPGQGGTRGS